MGRVSPADLMPGTRGTRLQGREPNPLARGFGVGEKGAASQACLHCRPAKCAGRRGPSHTLQGADPPRYHRRPGVRPTGAQLHPRRELGEPARISTTCRGVAYSRGPDTPSPRSLNFGSPCGSLSFLLYPGLFYGPASDSPEKAGPPERGWRPQGLVPRCLPVGLAYSGGNPSRWSILYSKRGIGYNYFC